MQNFGILCLLPPLVVIVVAIITRKSFEPLLIGCLVGFCMIDYTQVLPNFSVAIIKVMQDESMVWVIMVCGLYGALIQLLVQSGGAHVFGNFVLKYIKNRRAALISTWFLGIFLFIDDYLNALTTGTTMRRVSDHFKVSREMFAYIVSSTAVPSCVLVPLSTWSIYIGKLIENEGLTPKGDGFYGYIRTIVYQPYAWCALGIVPLVIWGVVPIFGKMKTAETRAFTQNILAPKGSEKMSLDVKLPTDLSKSRPAHFFLPLLVLIATTIYLDIDALKGIFVALFFTVLYYFSSRVMAYDAIFEGMFEGFKSMIFTLSILLMSYMLKEVGDQMGLTQYVIESLKTWVTAPMLPFAIFVSLGVIAFATGSSWGIYAVAIPLVVPVAQALGCNVWVALGAVISAGSFGAHACFYSDATLLASAGAGCDNVQHALTQLPYALISAAVSALVFLAIGFM
jgi:Na+/H+ antiporter NhaC